MAFEIFSIVISAFIIGFFATAIANGPVTFLAFKNALTNRHKEGILIISGSAVMEVIYCFISLGFVGIIFLYGEKIELFSKILSAIVFFAVGIYLLSTKINYKEKSGKKEFLLAGTKSFFTGFILILINPSVILTWSAASTLLISLNIISINNLADIALFSLSAGFGIICGGFFMVSLVHKYRIKFSGVLPEKLLRILGVIVFLIGAYFLIELIQKF